MQTETTVTEAHRAERSRYQRAISLAGELPFLQSEDRRPAKDLVRARGAAAVVLAAVALLAPSARAQEGGVSVPLAARESHETNALEIAVGLGSAMGFGTAVPGGPSLGDMGAGVDLAAGWRINPRWMVGVYSANSVYSGTLGGANTTFGTSAGVQANYYSASPGRPWLGLGTGWHGYWLAQDTGRTTYQGLDLVRLQAGVDVPVTPSLSVEPMLGVTLSTFLSQKASAAAAYVDVKSSGVSVFVFTGVLARFDLFGHAANEPLVLARNLAPAQR